MVATKSDLFGGSFDLWLSLLEPYETNDSEEKEVLLLAMSLRIAASKNTKFIPCHVTVLSSIKCASLRVGAPIGEYRTSFNIIFVPDMICRLRKWNHRQCFTQLGMLP